MQLQPLSNDSGYEKCSRDLLWRKISVADLDSVIRELTDGKIYLLAGAVRDALLSVIRGVGIHTNDFDVAVMGVSETLFHRTAARLEGKRNRHGGYRIKLRSGNDLDLWRIEDTLGLRQGLQEANLRNVLRSFVLDINAVAFDFQTNSFLDLGAARAIHQSRIDLLPEAILHSQSSFSSRAILLALRLSFGLSDRLAQFVRLHFEPAAFRYELKKLSGDDAVQSGNAMLRTSDLERMAPNDLIELTRSSRYPRLDN